MRYEGDMSPHSARRPDVQIPPGPGVPGVATVTSALLMRAPAHAVYGFLEPLANHALFTGRRLRLEGVSADGLGARIAIRGPLGIRRTAHTKVTNLEPPSRFGGTAAVGRRTMAYVHWGIDRAGAGSRVTLTATIVRAGVLDRLLLALGGKWWLARSFDRAVALLATALAVEEPCAQAAG